MKTKVIAVGYQGSKEAVAPDLPKSGAMTTCNVKIMNNTRSFFECAYDTDYAVDEGGAGKTASSLIARLLRYSESEFID